MPFVPFQTLCPEVAARETRSIAVLSSLSGVPAGKYQFIELFCDEPGCDCRRVMFTVFSAAAKKEVAVVAWGWEDAAFYTRWLGMNDRAMVREMIGPILNMTSRQTPYSKAVLRIVQDNLETDPAYVERIKAHYALFREKVGGTGETWDRRPLAEKPLGARGAAEARRRKRKRMRRR